MGPEVEGGVVDDFDPELTSGSEDDAPTEVVDESDIDQSVLQEGGAA